MTVEWRAGQPVWLKAPEGAAVEPYAAGVVQEVGPKQLTVRKLDGSTVTADPAAVLPANPEGTTAPDHCGLIHLNEPCVLQNSRARYDQDAICQLAGLEPSSAGFNTPTRC